MKTKMKNEFALNYVVILNDGVNEYEAEAGFNSLSEAAEYADKKASEREAFNPSDSTSVYCSARVAHYEVIDVNASSEAWETKHQTQSFYND